MGVATGDLDGAIAARNHPSMQIAGPTVLISAKPFRGNDRENTHPVSGGEKIMHIVRRRIDEMRRDGP